MQKKNKLMLAAAVAMVAIVVTSTAVRCSVSHTAADDAERQQGQPVEQADEPDGADVSSEQEVPKDTTDLGTGILAVLRGGVWQAPGDPQKTIAFRDGSFVESDGSSVTLAAFDVVGAGEAGGQRYLDVRIMRDGSPAAQTSTIILEGADGSLEVASDGFAGAKRYIQSRAPETPVIVEGVREPYTDLVDGKAGELAAAISEWCAAHAPSATRATFDGEVYLDVANDRVSATFHLDDAARSIVTAVYEGGAFSVSG